ncbi:hypothetical protein [Halospeciosus flavus]|uniref:Integral membrane protein n=1 Tax=Halospeciosus flavus TaxID=3032283 RepID=A0ABD5Z4E2_9EURY|nr:hypothetical protein [Halospeciosus flavus]
MDTATKRRVGATVYLLVFAGLVGGMLLRGGNSPMYWVATGFLAGVGLTLVGAVSTGRWRTVAILQGVLFLGGGVLYLVTVTRGATSQVRLLLGVAWCAVGVWGVFRGATRPFDDLRPDWVGERSDAEE